MPPLQYAATPYQQSLSIEFHISDNLLLNRYRWEITSVINPAVTMQCTTVQTTCSKMIQLVPDREIKH